MSLVVIIPAFRPGQALVDLVRELSTQSWNAIVVVNDGSEARFDFFFDSVRGFSRVTVLTHAVNLGKGAALKTGIHHALRTIPGLIGLVTADADGQHAPEDIRRVGEALAADPSRARGRGLTRASLSPIESYVQTAVCKPVQSSERPPMPAIGGHSEIRPFVPSLAAWS